MSEEPTTLFRAEAFERYRENRERAVLPRFARPRMLRGLSIVTVLLIAATSLLWCDQVPAYVDGTAVILEGGAASGPSWLVVLPASAQGKLRAGQPVLLSPGDHGRMEARSVVVAVVGRALPAREVTRRWSLPERIAAALPEHCDIGILRGVPQTGRIGVGNYAYVARVEVRRVRLIALLLSHAPRGVQ